MAFREAPIKEQRIDAALASKGFGSASEVVMARIIQGWRVSDIARYLSAETGVSLAGPTLYGWIRRWREASGNREEAAA